MEETKYLLEWDEEFESKISLDDHYHRLELLGRDMKSYRKVIITIKREIYE